MTRAASLCVRVTAQVGRLAIEVALDTRPGILVLVGPNGAGKSSLLSLVLGVQPVRTGRISVGESVLLDTQAGIALPIERRRLGYVPQDYALFPRWTVRENLEFAIASANPAPPRAEQAARVTRLLTELGLEPHADRSTRHLSGGEKQRLALARALSVGPRALLLDEPLAALDVHARGEVRTYLADYLQQLGLPTIVVTHDAADARRLGQTIAVLEQGKITQAGTWDELCQNPRTRFIEEFVAS